MTEELSFNVPGKVIAVMNALMFFVAFIQIFWLQKRLRDPKDDFVIPEPWSYDAFRTMHTHMKGMAFWIMINIILMYVLKIDLDFKLWTGAIGWFIFTIGVFSMKDPLKGIGVFLFLLHLVSVNIDLWFNVT
tara:strand:- start:431 stop:826 length:396 start_codon:yes stop_codon:yes gene_type:complete